jgi:hypothetical protein
MDQVGKPLDPWQQLMVLDTFGLRDDGYWSAFECVGLVPRQNGKGGYTEAVELGGLFLFGDQLIMHSAHLFKTSKQSFQRIIDIIDSSDWLTRRVHKVTRARGDEEIELTAKAGGGKLMYFSRSGGAGRGFTGDKTIFDECAYLTIDQYQAATPTLATVPNPQIIYTGTPPDEDTGPMPEDAMTPSVRRRGHAGGPRIALWEWSPPKGFDRRSPAVWAACNPALGVRIQPWFLAQQLENFTEAGKPAKFDTEHLGLWPAEGGAQWAAFNQTDWEGAEATFDPPESLALTVVLSGDRQWASICAAGSLGGGKYGVAVLDRREGTGWVTQRLFERARKLKPVAVLINKSGPEGSLWAEVSEANLAELGKPDGTVIELVQVGPQNLAAACESLWDGVCGPSSIDPDTNETVSPRVVKHLGQVELTNAAAGAVWKVSASGARMFDPSVGDPSTLFGVALALQGYREREPAVMEPWAFSM